MNASHPSPFLVGHGLPPSLLRAEARVEAELENIVGFGRPAAVDLPAVSGDAARAEHASDTQQSVQGPSNLDVLAAFAFLVPAAALSASASAFGASSTMSSRSISIGITSTPRVIASSCFSLPKWDHSLPKRASATVRLLLSTFRSSVGRERRRRPLGCALEPGP